MSFFSFLHSLPSYSTRLCAPCDVNKEKKKKKKTCNLKSVKQLTTLREVIEQSTAEHGDFNAGYFT